MLYLIPVPLSPENSIQELSPFIPEKVSGLKKFIVEDLRSARRFMRKCGYAGDFSDVEFLEIKSSTSSGIINAILKENINDEIGLISDSGMPCIADPGSAAVWQAHALNIQVHTFPGPSSLLITLAASGFNGQQFTFHGYLPIKKNELINKIIEIEKDLIKSGKTQLFIETPFRTQSLFEEIIKHCGNETALCIGKNLCLEAEEISTHFIRDWKNVKPQLHKNLVVFALGKPVNH
jgi:16S rRNA (cytidine1402-2'-O)-methyltransferase